MTEKDSGETDRARTEFISRISHELRTPMSGIIGMTDLALETKLSEEQRDYLSMIRISTESLLAVVTDIVDYARLDDGLITFEAEDFDLHVALREAVDSVALPKGRDAGRIEISVDRAAPTAVRADRARLKQIVAAVVDSAARVAREGDLRLSLHPAAAENAWHFVVADNAGSVPEARRFLFDRYGSLSPADRRALPISSVRLGLTVSARLIQALGGAIWLERSPGHGLAFHFVIPLHSSEAGPADAPARAPRESAPRGLRVLLVEDHPINRALALRLLQRAGHEALIATRGSEALDALEHEAIDLILMDVEMPDIDGLEITARIRAREARLERDPIPIIAVTAHISVEDRERFLAAGMDGHLAKPLSHESLTAAIATIALPDRPPHASAIDDATFETDIAALGREFADLSAGELLTMNESLDRGDLEALGKQAHRFAGAAGVFQAPEPSRLARALESVAKQGDSDGAHCALVALSSAVAALKEGAKGDGRF